MYSYSILSCRSESAARRSGQRFAETPRARPSYTVTSQTFSISAGNVANLSADMQLASELRYGRLWCRESIAGRQRRDRYWSSCRAAAIVAVGRDRPHVSALLPTSGCHPLLSTIAPNVRFYTTASIVYPPSRKWTTHGVLLFLAHSLSWSNFLC